MNIIPDCTIVTSCFCFHSNNNSALSEEEVLEQSEEVLKLPVFLVIYCDKNMMPILESKRNSYGLGKFTKFITLELNEIWSFQYLDKVNKNRELYWPSRTNRHQTDSHLIQCNKFDFMLKTIDSNPFNTSKFAWIDCFLRKNASKICENYNVEKILYILHNITDKFHIQVLNVCDKKFKQKENKREYYQEYRWVVCGCFVTCGKEIGTKIFTRLKEIVVETTEAGYGHGEEMFYLEILDEFCDDVIKSYGDYGQLLNNFIEPTINFHYIYYFISNRYLQLGYYKECYECTSLLLKQVETFKVSICSDVYMKILFNHYFCILKYKPTEVTSFAAHIYDVCNQNPYMKNEFNLNASYYESHLQLSNKFKQKCKIIFCIFGCATNKKYKDEILKIEETWGNYAEKKGIRVLYFLGEENTDLQNDSKFIYLKNVKNDYSSASYKQNLGLKYTYENFDSEYVFVCGTDTYVNVEKLLSFIENLDCNKKLYIGGHGHDRFIGNKNMYFHGGGGGIILSKASLYFLYPKLWNMVTDWKNVCLDNKTFDYNIMINACDVAISYYLQEELNNDTNPLQIIKRDDLFYFCNHKGYCYNNTYNCCVSKINMRELISCHNMTLTDFDDFTKILTDNNFFI